VRAQSGRPTGEDAPPIVHDLGRALLLPGFVNAHSHAFQRAIRGATHRRGQHDPSSFWSWREAMYRAATSLDPEALFSVTRACFAEMLRAGITCVGEFHYLHHNPDGAPYADPNELSHQVVRAAAVTGIRLVLLEVYYARAGAGRERPARTAPLLRRLASTPTCAASTPCAARACTSASPPTACAPSPARPCASSPPTPTPTICRCTPTSRSSRKRTPSAGRARPDPDRPARRDRLPRPPRRLHGRPRDPPRAADFTALAGQHVCACPTTEADLGDGIIPASEHLRHGVQLALGSDSNAVVDLVQEARLLEMHERLRTRARLCLADRRGHQPGRTLLDIATRGGALSLGRPELGRLRVGAPFDACTVDLAHPSLAGIDPANALDALLLSGTAAAIDRVFVGGTRVR
jgi:formimidoylglutamate deiminase